MEASSDPDVGVLEMFCVIRQLIWEEQKDQRLPPL